MPTDRDLSMTCPFCGGFRGMTNCETCSLAEHTHARCDDFVTLAEGYLRLRTELAKADAAFDLAKVTVMKLEGELAKVTAELADTKALADERERTVSHLRVRYGRLHDHLAESNRERDALHWVAKVFSGLLMDAADIPVPDMYDAKAVREALRTLLRQRDEARKERDANMWAHARSAMGSGDFVTVRGEDGRLHDCFNAGHVLRAWYPRHADRLIAERTKTDVG